MTMRDNINTIYLNSPPFQSKTNLPDVALLKTTSMKRLWISMCKLHIHLLEMILLLAISGLYNWNIKNGIKKWSYSPSLKLVKHDLDSGWWCIFRHISFVIVMLLVTISRLVFILATLLLSSCARSIEGTVNSSNIALSMCFSIPSYAWTANNFVRRWRVVQLNQS